MTEQHKNIFEALMAVYKEIGYVQKKGKNTQQNYKYAGEAQFIEEIRPHLIEHGIVFYPHRVDTAINSTILLDKRQNRIVATYTFRFHHVSSGTFFDAVAVGEGVDPTDKSAYKAATGALKYALRQSLLIETGDDPEKDQEDTKREPVFKNSSLRNTFCKNVITAFTLALDEESLAEVAGMYKADFAKMDAGGEHDLLAVEELRKRYVVRKKEIAREKELSRQADGGNFDARLSDDLHHNQDQ